MAVFKKSFMAVLMMILAGIMLISGCGNEKDSEGIQKKISFNPEALEEEAEAAGMNIFYEDETGYAIFYPDHWTYEESGTAITFSDPEYTNNNNYPSVRMQNMLSQEAGGVYADMESVFEAYKLQFGGADRHIIEKEEVVFKQDGMDFPAIHFLAEYEREEETIRQWTALLQRDNNYFLQFNYTTPAEQYEEYKDISGEMWLSLTFTR